MQRSKHNTGARSLVLVLEKVRRTVHTHKPCLVGAEASLDRVLVRTAAQAEPGFWPRLLQAKGPAPRHLKGDWNMWVDEDEEDEKPQRAAHV